MLRIKKIDEKRGGKNQQKVFSIIALFSGVLLLTGCEGLRAISFEKATESGIKEQQIVKLFRLGGDPQRRVPIEILQKGLAADALKHEIRKCHPEGPPEFLATPLLVAGGQYLFGQILDALAGEAAKLRKRAQRTYGANTVINEGVFSRPDDKECLLLVRYGTEVDDEKNPNVVQINDIGLAVMLHKQTVGKGLTFKLHYVWMPNSVAVTDAQSRTLKLSIALSANGYDRGDHGYRARPLGQSSLSLDSVVLRSDRPQLDCGDYDPRNGITYERTCEAHKFLDLFDIPEASATGGVISMAVTETGSPAKAEDRAKAETDALKQAFGGAIGSVIESILTGSD